MKAVVNSEKHIYQLTTTTVGLGALSSLSLAAGVASPAGAVASVRVGSKITAVYIEIWITSDDAAQGSFNVNVEKLPGGGTAMTYAQATTLHSYPNKNNVLFVSQGLNAPTVANPIPVIRGWIKIPKGKQRFGLGDSLRLNISGISNGLNYCMTAIYKEQY